LITRLEAKAKQPDPTVWRSLGGSPDRPADATLRSALATWRSGYAAACKAVYTGSIPVVAFSPI
jgi:hypothetical protein